MNVTRRRALAPHGGPTTYVSDSFNRANGALGNADTGQAWTVAAGSITIVSNAAVSLGTTSTAFVNVGTGITDQLVSATYRVGPNFGLTGRRTDDSNFYLAQESNPTTAELYKCVGGSFTQIGTVPMGVSATAGDIFGLSCKGTAIKMLRNGTVIIAVTDSALTTGTGAGLRGGTSGDSWDDFLVISP